MTHLHTHKHWFRTYIEQQTCVHTQKHTHMYHTLPTCHCFFRAHHRYICTDTLTYITYLHTHKHWFRTYMQQQTCVHTQKHTHMYHTLPTCHRFFNALWARTHIFTESFTCKHMHGKYAFGHTRAHTYINAHKYARTHASPTLLNLFYHMQHTQKENIFMHTDMQTWTYLLVTIWGAFRQGAFERGDTMSTVDLWKRHHGTLKRHGKICTRG